MSLDSPVETEVYTGVGDSTSDLSWDILAAIDSFLLQLQEARPNPPDETARNLPDAA